LVHGLCCPLTTEARRHGEQPKIAANEREKLRIRRLDLTGLGDRELPISAPMVPSKNHCHRSLVMSRVSFDFIVPGMPKNTNQSRTGTAT
jgi:hypothetical protein